MSRGSKIGERRGGRERWTPNRRTVFVDRILAIASERQTTSANDFIEILAKDKELPADLRMAIARKFLPAVRSAPVETRGAKLPKPSSIAKSISLEVLFSTVQDTAVPPEQRRQAASEVARYFLPKKPGIKRWWVNAPVDEYGFAITSEIAAEYRDARFEVRRLSRTGSNNPRTRNKIEKLRARMNAILHRLQCPCPSLYGIDQWSNDSARLIYFLQRRDEKINLSEAETAEEAHRRARCDSFVEGPESAARQRLTTLADKLRRFRNRVGPPLTRKERTDWRFLRRLYPSPKPRTYHADDELRYHPLRDEPFAEDGNLYPADSKLRPLKYEDIEEYVDIPPYCYPPHAKLPPLKEGDVLYVDPAGYRWSHKLIG
jgi:hypothetical protein